MKSRCCIIWELLTAFDSYGDVARTPGSCIVCLLTINSAVKPPLGCCWHHCAFIITSFPDILHLHSITLGLTASGMLLVENAMVVFCALGAEPQC